MHSSHHMGLADGLKRGFMPTCEIPVFSEIYEQYLRKRLYALADLTAAEELGVLKLRRQIYPDLTGRGILLGIADTGIDYTNPVFRNRRECRKPATYRLLPYWCRPPA